MGYFDKMRDKAAEVARTRGEWIGDTVDKTAAGINRRTGGKHADKVSKYAQQAKRKVNELGDDGRGTGRAGEESPPGPPPNL